jgi:outer membrane protein TolC
MHVNVAAQTKQAETITLSLKQAQEFAIKNNVDSKNRTLDMEIAKKQIWEITAAGLPQINAQANYQHLFKVPEMSLGGSTYLATNLPSGTNVTSDDITNNNVFMGFTPAPPIKLGVKDNTTLDITVSQLIFSGEYIVGLQASKVFYQFSEQKKMKTELETKEAVANVYAMALLLENNRDVMQKSLDNSKKTLSDMKQMLAQGLLENTDVDQIEFVTNTLENGVSNLNRDIDIQMLNIKYILGIPFTDKVVLTDKLESIAESIKLETLIATPFNINDNLDFQMILNAEAISTLNLKREKSAYLPNLAAVYRHSAKMNKPEFDFAPTDVFQISMNIPIFSSGMRNVRVQQKQLELQKTINLKENLNNGLQLNYVNALNKLNQAYETYVNDQKNIELTKRIYDKTLTKFSEGIATSREITDNLSQYLNAQRSLYTSIFALFTAKNQLDKLNNNL